MIHLRNHILCKPATFALDSIEEGLWTASRIQHYPPGGGFMSAHRDDLVIDAASDVGLGFLQLLLVLSQKGKDYLSGGGFIIKDNKFIDIEEETCLGDIILYDGDLAGANAALRGIDILLQEGLQVRVTVLPQGKKNYPYHKHKYCRHHLLL